MLRGLLATTAAIALVLGVEVSGFDGQHGNGGQHGNSNNAHATQPSAHGNSTVKPTGTPAPANAATTTTTTSKTTTTKTTTGTTGTVTLSPVQQKLSTHTQLANKLQSRLPAGTNVVTAASGFRNLGQFVAAVNVSHNLGIPFSQLKTDMVTNQMSLGQAIHALRPSANGTHEAERAETEAKTEIDVETRTTSTKVTTTKRTSGDR